MHPSTTALLLAVVLLINPVTARPRPSPQWSYTPIDTNLKCPNIEPCPQGLPLVCGGGNLFCDAVMVTYPRGKCSDCAGSMCAKSSDDYPGDSTPRSLRAGSEVVEEGVTEKRDSELAERQVFGGYCQAQWECACVSFDGKGYYSRGKGGQCSFSEGALETCNDTSGFLCIFGCRSKLLSEFTNAKCHALFPGTRAQCQSR
ncbi:hypothetical protein V8F20_002833 [Naviculisporaceae sp. PSN 640]